MLTADPAVDASVAQVDQGRRPHAADLCRARSILELTPATRGPIR
jgi:hypothetical protein